MFSNNLIALFLGHKWLYTDLFPSHYIGLICSPLGQDSGTFVAPHLIHLESTLQMTSIHRYDSNTVHLFRMFNVEYFEFAHKSILLETWPRNKLTT